MFVLIDNYDSFTYNLFHFLGELGAEVEVWRNDAIQVAEVLEKRPQGIVIFPGPAAGYLQPHHRYLETGAPGTKVPLCFRPPDLADINGLRWPRIG